MDDEDRTLFERSLARRHWRSTPAARSTPRSAELGWLDALSIDPRGPPSPCCSSFREPPTQPRRLSAGSSPTPSAWASGPEIGIVLPPSVRCEPPGTVDGDDLLVDGLAAPGSPADRGPP